MMPEQVQELVINTIRDVMNMGSMMGPMPQLPQQPPMQPEMGAVPPEALPPGGQL